MKYIFIYFQQTQNIPHFIICTDLEFGSNIIVPSHVYHKTALKTIEPVCVLKSPILESNGVCFNECTFCFSLRLRGEIQFSANDVNWNL